MKAVPQVRRILADDGIAHPGKASSENIALAGINLRVAIMIKNIRVGEFIDAEMQESRRRQGDTDKNESSLPASKPWGGVPGS